jgi:hypothetical protein
MPESNPSNKATQTPDNTKMCGSGKGSCKILGDAECDGDIPDCSMKIGVSNASTAVATLEEGCECPPKPGTVGTLIRKLSRFGAFLGLRTDKQYLSDVDKRDALNAALRTKGKGGYMIVAVFDDMFVYEDWSKGGIYSQGYSISDGGRISLKDDAVQVRPVTEFVPVTTNATKETSEMSTKAKVDALIANQRTRFQEKDRVFLEKLADNELDLLTPVDEPNPASTKLDAATTTAASTAAPKATATQPANASTSSEAAPTNNAVTDLESLNKLALAGAASPKPQEKKPPTVAEYIAGAPQELQEVLNEGLRLQTEQKEQLIKGILENKGNKFAEPELRMMSLALLDRLAGLAQVTIVADYGMRAGSVTRVAKEDPLTTAMPEVFPRAQAFVPPAPGIYKQQDDPKTKAA